MKKNLSNILFCLISLVTIVPVSGQDHDMVTFADFNNIRYIASSISHVYFTTTEGIVWYDKYDKKWEQPLTSSTGIDHRDIHRIWVDEFGEKLYVQTSDSYYEYEFLFDSWYSITSLPQLNLYYEHVKLDNVMYPPAGFNFSNDGYLSDPYGRDFEFTDIIDDQGGNTWMGTWSYGASFSQGSSGIIELLPYGLIQNHVQAIYDDMGILYLGGRYLNSFRSGVTIFDPDSNSFAYIESGLFNQFSRDNINCFEADDEYIYIGTDMGLYLWNRDSEQITKKISRNNGLPDDIVYALGKNGDSILVGTSSGLTYIFASGDSLGFIRPDQFNNTEIYDFESTDSSIWIATSKGAFQFYPESYKLQKFIDPHAVVYNLVYKIKKTDNLLWLSSSMGFVSLDLKTGETKPYTNVFNRPGRNPFDVNRRVIAVGVGTGFKLIYYNKADKQKERQFTTDDGLPSNQVNCLLFDGDFLWIGTDYGLTRFLWNNPYRVD